MTGSLAAIAHTYPLILYAIAAAGLMWGSFLNYIAVRCLSDRPFYASSACAHCMHPLAWYQQIPLLSWILLHGACAHCHQSISLWYPLIELLSACWALALALTQPYLYIPALILFGSALLITLRTDGEHFMILRLCTLGLMPTGLIASYYGGLPISCTESILGLMSGIAILLLVRWTFQLYRGYEGLGEGDIELLGMIGSFVGPSGVWLTLMIASLSGTAYALLLIVFRRASYTTPIPFGLFLALAGGLTALAQPYLLSYLAQ